MRITTMNESSSPPSVQTNLGPMPSPVLDLAYSSDGRHLAMVEGRGGKVLKEVRAHGRRIPIIQSAGTNLSVVADGRALSTHAYEKIAAVAPSPDSQHLAFVGWRDSKPRMVLDAREGPTHEGFMIESLCVSPDSKHVAYAASKGQRWFAVVDGQAGIEYNDIGGLTFSPDSKRLAYIASNDQKQFVVADGRAGLEYEVIGKGSPIFSGDSNRVGYGARRGSKWIVLYGLAAGGSGQCPSRNHRRWVRL
jgi:WD40 repeat protein